MAVIVYDSVPVNNIGININEFTITCRGTYEIAKQEVNDGPVYHIRTVLYWILSGATQPIFIEQMAFSVGTVPADIFAEIYDRVKARYVSTADV